MSDMYNGQTMTESYEFKSAGAAYTFTFGFQPDKVVFYNLTAGVGGAGKVGTFPIVTWFRDQTTTGYAFQHVVVDTAASASYNFLCATSNGFTVADTTGGVADCHKSITSITQANPCVVGITSHGFQDGQLVRLTDLGASMPTAHGMDELNNNKYKIVYLTANTFSLQDAITGEDIDSTSFVAYVSGGVATLITHTMQFNMGSSTYISNDFRYDPITYKLTAGTAVMGSDNDIFRIEVIKYGKVTDLGDLA